MMLYKIDSEPPEAEQLAELIVMQCEELHKAVKNLEKSDHVPEYCVEVNRLENEADPVSRAPSAASSTRSTIPSSHQVEGALRGLETATDKAEDAANVLGSVVVKSA